VGAAAAESLSDLSQGFVKLSLWLKRLKINRGAGVLMDGKKRVQGAF